jgi:hypothetical protein
MPAPWENDPIIAPAATAMPPPGASVAAPAAGDPPGTIYGNPKRPPAQTGAQAEGDVLSVEQRRQQLEDAPLDRRAKEEQVLNAQSGRDNQHFNQVQSLRQEFYGRPDIRSFFDSRNTFKQILRLGQTGNAQTDMGLIFTFMKSLDPASAVREGEFANAQNAAGVPDRVRNYYNQLTTGGRLNPEQRDEMVRTAQQMYIARAEAYNDVANQYRTYFQQLGEDPRIHIPLALGPEIDRRREEAKRTIMDGGNPDGGGPLEVTVSDERRRGETDEQYRARIAAGQTDRPPDISEARGSGGLLETVDAGVRSTANLLTLGGADKIAAGMDTLFGADSKGENLARQDAISGYDSQHHPTAQLVGDIAGAFLIPTTVVGVGRVAATEALAAGRTAEEAAGMAKAAMARRMAAESAGYGAAHGAVTTDGDALDKASGALVEGLLGAAGGYLAGKVMPSGLAAQASEKPPLVDPLSGRLNEPLESVRPAERVDAARGYGIDLPLGSASDRGGAIVEKGLDVLPPSAGRMNDARREVGAQVENAVEDVAGRYGQARTPFAGGQALQEGANRWISRFDEVSTKAYEAIPIPPAAPAVVDSTRATLNRLTSIFPSNPKLAEVFRNSRLQDYREALAKGGLSWNDLKALRSRIGYEIGEQRFSDSPTKDELRALYGAMSEDMRATAVAQGPRAVNAFERANTLYQNGQERIEGALVALLGDDSKANPEAAAATLAKIARSGRGSSNLRQLSQIRASLMKGGEWDEFASSLVRLGGQPANSEGRGFSPQTFVNWYADMSEPARNLLFGDRGRRDLRRALDGFVEVSQRLANTNALRNTSNTAPGFIGAGAVGALAAQVGSALAHPVTAALSLIGFGATGAANYGMAKLWTKPEFVRWATGYTRMVAAAERSGANPSAKALKSQKDYLTRLARSNPAIADYLLDIREKIDSAFQ